ncbi:MAG: TetR family transcriptional regulator [Solirubrobacteraceae bacterium]
MKRSRRQGAHVVEMQRRRLLSATTELVYERGVQGLTAALVAERAGMSRRTFHDIFSDREGCLLGAFDQAVDQASSIVGRAVAGSPMPAGGGRQEKWAGTIRTGLTALLCFLDEDPATGRLLVVEALSAGDRVLQARRRVLTQIVAIVDEGRAQARMGQGLPPLTAEGVVGAVLSVLHARMLERDPRPLVELLGSLMAIVVHPYLGPAAARRELDRPNTAPEQLAPKLPTDPFKDLPMRLTYRTARVLTTIAATPGASSKQVADAAGITDVGQTSKLLNRLARNGLIQDTGIGPTKGLPRAWTLTQRGQHILHALGEG